MWFLNNWGDLCDLTVTVYAFLILQMGEKIKHYFWYDLCPVNYCSYNVLGEQKWLLFHPHHWPGFIGDTYYVI